MKFSSKRKNWIIDIRCAKVPDTLFWKIETVYTIGNYFLMETLLHSTYIESTGRSSVSWFPVSC